VDDTRWCDCELGDLLTLQRGFDLPYHARKPGRVPIVSSSGLSGYHSEAKCKAPGIVTGRYGTLGEVHFITEDYWPHNTALYVKDLKGNDPRFLYYLLWHTNLAHHNDKSGVPGVNRNDLHEIEVVRPPLPEQRAIARVLGALDDKIELSRRMNRTLEDMARALFNDWLERMEGELETVTTQSLTDSGVLVIGDGYRAKRSELRPTGLPFARAGNIDGGFQFTDCEYMGADGIQAAGDKLSRPLDSVFTSKGTVGRLALVSKNTPTFVYAPQLCFWRAADPSRLNPFVLHQWMHGDEFGEQVDMTKGQTDMADYVSLTDQRRMRITLPSPKRQAEVGRHLERLYGMMDQNTTQIGTLAALRDSLLPVLLSGELRLHHASAAVEEVLA
jgi:type I restriction enzyme, S subunit